MSNFRRVMKRTFYVTIWKAEGTVELHGPFGDDLDSAEQFGLDALEAKICDGFEVVEFTSHVYGWH